MTVNKQITRSNERMHTKIDWLESRHSFSFGGHYDPERMGFGPLRVVNDDHVAPSGGFPSHPHRDMEIISIVLDGELAHKDSMGNGRTISPGEIQYMSAGSGVVHSEFNPSDKNPVHFMQIWIEPNAQGLEPRYADQPIIGETEDKWTLVLSPDGRDGSMAIRQDVEMRIVKLSEGVSIDYEPSEEGRGLWLFVLNGAVSAVGETFKKGDSLAIRGLKNLDIKNLAAGSSEVMVFDVPV